MPGFAIWLDAEELDAIDRACGNEPNAKRRRPINVEAASPEAAARNERRRALLRRLLAQAAAQQVFEESPHLPAFDALPSRPALYAGIACASCSGPMAVVPGREAKGGLCYQACKGARERLAKEAAAQG